MVAGENIAKPLIVNAPGDGSHPICGFTYLLVYDDLTYLGDSTKARALVCFLEWALTEGQLTAPDLHYTPLRAEGLHLVKQIRYAAATAPQ